MIWLWILRRKGEGGVVSDDLLLHQRPPRDPRPINSPIHCNLPPHNPLTRSNSSATEAKSAGCTALCVNNSLNTWYSSQCITASVSQQRQTWAEWNFDGGWFYISGGGKHIRISFANIPVCLLHQLALLARVANLIKTLVPKTRRFQFVGGDWWVGGKGIDEGICFEVFSFF